MNTTSNLTGWCVFPTEELVISPKRMNDQYKIVQIQLQKYDEDLIRSRVSRNFTTYERREVTYRIRRQRWSDDHEIKTEIISSQILKSICDTGNLFSTTNHNITVTIDRRSETSPQEDKRWERGFTDFWIDTIGLLHSIYIDTLQLRLIAKVRFHRD